MSNKINSCEVCGARDLTTVLDLGANPICDDLVPLGDSRTCKKYPIEIGFCSECRTGHQRFQLPKRDLFPPNYHYRARFTKDVLDGMAEIVSSCERRFGDLTGLQVLDIGCNDGSLLNLFRVKGASCFGIEPTAACQDAVASGHRVWNEFFSVEIADQIAAEIGSAQIITFTNVFAHIEDLPSIIRALSRLIGPGTAIVIENHYLGSVLDKNQFDTFYHEHPRTYSFTSFTHIARSLGLKISDVEFPARYGGNIRVTLGGSSPVEITVPDGLLTAEAQFLRRFADLRTNVERWRVHRQATIKSIVAQHGPLRAKAFPARAAILLRLLGLDETSVTAVHEKPGSLKIGHYVPGTRIPIVSDDELFASGSHHPVLNLAWHIPNEIRTYLQSNGYKGPVIDIVEPSDFAAEAYHTT